MRRQGAAALRGLNPEDHSVAQIVADVGVGPRMNLDGREWDPSAGCPHRTTACRMRERM